MTSIEQQSLAESRKVELGKGCQNIHFLKFYQKLCIKPLKKVEGMRKTLSFSTNLIHGEFSAKSLIMLIKICSIIVHWLERFCEKVKNSSSESKNWSWLKFHCALLPYEPGWCSLLYIICMHLTYCVTWGHSKWRVLCNLPIIHNLIHQCITMKLD